MRPCAPLDYGPRRRGRKIEWKGREVICLPA